MSEEDSAGWLRDAKVDPGLADRVIAVEGAQGLIEKLWKLNCRGCWISMKT